MLRLLLLCVALFAGSSQAATTARQCSNNPSGVCMNLDKFYCNVGHQVSESGCGWLESCCSPYVEKVPEFYYGVDQCGVPSIHPGSNIVGGKEAAIEEFPWIVSLQKQGQAVCGASIVSDRWILTAAHCVESGAHLITIVAGTQKVRGVYESQLDRYQYSNIYSHGSYTKPEYGYDIALIKLTRPITLGTKKTRRICLPEKSENFDNRICVSSGWGYTHEPVGVPTADGGSATLRWANLPVVSRTRCAYYMGHVPLGAICAGYRSGGEDTCQGDSGGPFVCQRKDGTWTQAGVVSYGVGCGRGNKMGIYTDIAAFREWIDWVIANK